METKFEPQSKERLAVGMCRLRHGLNEHCLLHVLDYVDQMDLIQLCAMDAYYKDLIVKWTVKKKQFHLRQLQSDQQLEILKTFGKSIKKLKITSYFRPMLQHIIDYCEPGALTDIDLEINDVFVDILNRPDEIDSLNRLVLLAMPLFSNLRKLKFRNYPTTRSNGIFTNFLTQISATASNLNSIELIDVEPSGSWLQSVQQLSELRLCWIGESSLVNLIACLRAMPQLKVFELRHKLKNPSAIFDVLKKSCLRLEAFSEIDASLSNPYQHLDHQVISRYKFLSKFPNLSAVTLMSFTFCGCDLYYPLVALATKNIVKLKVIMNLSTPVMVSDECKAEIMRRPLPQFAALRSMEVEIWEQNNFYYHPKWTQCNLRCQFLFHFVRQVKNLQYFAYAGSSLSNMDEVLEFAPDIRVLDVSQTVSQENYYMVQRLVETLRYLRIRQLDDGKEDRCKLHLMLRDNEKVRIFLKNKDVKDLIDVTFTAQNKTINKLLYF